MQPTITFHFVYVPHHGTVNESMQPDGPAKTCQQGQSRLQVRMGDERHEQPSIAPVFASLTPPDKDRTLLSVVASLLVVPAILDNHFNTSRPSPAHRRPHLLPAFLTRT